jgi:hypothetical protein
MSLLREGIARAARGVRTGDQRLVYLGVGMMIWDWWRKSRKPARQLVYRKNLKPGDELTVRMSRPPKV